MRRANYIGAPEFFLLNQACQIVEAAFDFGVGTMLVGSSLTKRDYRDVDIRCILRDEDFERLFPGTQGASNWRHPLWSLMCSSISLFLSKASGLPIDFQIQSMTEANHDYPSPEHQRCAVGIFGVDIKAKAHTQRAELALRASLSPVDRDVDREPDGEVANVSGEGGEPTLIIRKKLGRDFPFITRVAGELKEDVLDNLAGHTDPIATGEQTRKKNRPICYDCNDSHIRGDNMCTSCPSPCEACRSRGPGQAGGPFCETTPCTCTGHRLHHQYAGRL